MSENKYVHLGKTQDILEEMGDKNGKFPTQHLKLNRFETAFLMLYPQTSLFSSTMSYFSKWHLHFHTPSYLTPTSDQSSDIRKQSGWE